MKFFRNSGIYHFTESALGFYVDSTRTDYKTNVEFLISGERLIEENGLYIEKPFKVQTIKEINVTTDYSFTRKEESIKDTVFYNGIKFLSYNKLRYNPKHLAQSIFFKTKRNLQRHFKQLNKNTFKIFKEF